VQERHTVKLMAKPGVVGTAIGLNDKGRHIILIFLENLYQFRYLKKKESVRINEPRSCLCWRETYQDLRNAVPFYSADPILIQCLRKRNPKAMNAIPRG